MKAIAKAGMSSKKENKYRLVTVLGESELRGIAGYNTQLEDGTEKFFFKEQITFLAHYIQRIAKIKKDLLILEKAGLQDIVEESFKSLCFLEEELSYD